LTFAGPAERRRRYRPAAIRTSASARARGLDQLGVALIAAQHLFARALRVLAELDVVREQEP
jgi:hypothetical protein